MTTTKPLNKMNLKELRAAWVEAFGRPTNSKDADGLRAKLAEHHESKSKRKEAIKAQAKGKTVAAKTATAKDADRITHENAANVARDCEANGEWSKAEQQWLRAAELATSKKLKASYAGKAAAAAVRAQAKPAAEEPAVEPVAAELAPDEAAAAEADDIAAPLPPADPSPMHDPNATADSTPPVGAFVHDPRVLAKYAVGSVIEHHNKKSGNIHRILVRSDGFEYLGPLDIPEKGQLFTKLNRLGEVVKEGGRWNAFLVFGLDKPSARKKGGERAALHAGGYGAGHGAFMAAGGFVTPEGFAAVLGAAAAGSATALAKLEEIVQRTIASTEAAKVMGAAATRALVSARAAATKATPSTIPAEAKADATPDVAGSM